MQINRRISWARAQVAYLQLHYHTPKVPRKTIFPWETQRIGQEENRFLFRPGIIESKKINANVDDSVALKHTAETEMLALYLSDFSETDAAAHI